MIKVTFQIGDGQIHAVVHQKQSPSPTMVNVPHDLMKILLWRRSKTNIERHGGRGNSLNWCIPVNDASDLI